MNNSEKKQAIFLVLVPAVIVALFIGMYIGNKIKAPAAPVSGGEEVISSGEFEPFWKAWQVLDSKYVAAASTSDQVKVWGAIKGLASSYGDPYTVFFPPVESKMFQEDISGNFEGVGMEIGIKNEQLQVISPIKGSPAERAGVKTGDYILTINGTSTQDMSVDQAVKLIRGPKGTVVKINFFIPGTDKTVERALTRDIINIPTLETSVEAGGIYVIRLYSFSAQSPELFRRALRDFILSGNTKLILDLRGNPGGYLEAAWDMASYFLPVGRVVVTEDFGQNGTPNIFRSKGYSVPTGRLKMLVLVDGGTASASEILAGALAEHDVAKLVGSKTFGKGSVQELIPITKDTSLKVTIARWLTPQGHNLSENGLEPDYKVEPTEKDAAAHRDVVLEKAVELLNSGKI